MILLCIGTLDLNEEGHSDQMASHPNRSRPIRTMTSADF